MALCSAIAIENDQLPEWIELIPAGRFQGRDGRAWNNSNPVAVVTAFERLAQDLPVDIEHSTELKAKSGDPAPAVGWVGALEERSGVIWGRVSWTDAGSAMLNAREYRYHSPVFYHDDAGNVSAVASVGLTNQPNLYFTALNQHQQQESFGMSLSELIRQALGLDDKASEQDAVTAINQIKSDRQVALNQAQQPSLDKYVPRADYDQAVSKAANAQQKLDEHLASEREAQIDLAVESALSEGKITPATADYHKAQCRDEGGLDRFAEFVKVAPVIAGDSGLAGKTPVKSSNASLSDDEKAICRAMGVTDAEFIKRKEAE